MSIDQGPVRLPSKHRRLLHPLMACRVLNVRVVFLASPQLTGKWTRMDRMLRGNEDVT